MKWIIASLAAFVAAVVVLPVLYLAWFKARPHVEDQQDRIIAE